MDGESIHRATASGHRARPGQSECGVAGGRVTAGVDVQEGRARALGVPVDGGRLLCGLRTAFVDGDAVEQRGLALDR